jgi:hypothetical protein
VIPNPRRAQIDDANRRFESMTRTDQGDALLLTVRRWCDTFTQRQISHQPMKTILSCLIASIFFFNVTQAKEPGAFSHSTQMIVVTTDSWDSQQGTLRRYERERPGNPWQAVGQPITVMIGKSGLGWGTGLLVPPQEANDPVKKATAKLPRVCFA